jgi:translation initiation factor IF-2
MSRSVSDSPVTGSRELEWLAEVLWGPTPGVELVVGSVPSGVPATSGGACPASGTPRVLVPLASRGRARRRSAGGMTRQPRLAKAAVPAPAQRRPAVVAAPPRAGRGRRRPGRGEPARRPRARRPRPPRPGGRDRARPGPAQPQAGGPAHRPRRPADRLHEGRLERPDPAPGPGRGRHAPAPGHFRPAQLHRPRPAPPGPVAGAGHHHQLGPAAHRLLRRGRRYALPLPVSRRDRRPRRGGETSLGERVVGRAQARLAPIPARPGRPGAHPTLGAPGGPGGRPGWPSGPGGDWARGDLRSTRRPARLGLGAQRRRRVPLGFDLLRFGYQTALQGWASRQRRPSPPARPGRPAPAPR